MFKKALILCLAVCMLSVNVFAGSTMLSLESDYSEVSGSTMPAEVTVEPEMVRVVEDESAGTQTIYYWNAADRPNTQDKSNTKESTTEYAAKFKVWNYLKVPVNGLTSVNAATVTAKLRFNTGKTTFYIRALDKAVWDNAVSNLTSGNSKTINSTDTDLHAVPAGETLWSKYNEEGVAITTYNDIASDALTEYINSGAADNYIYLAVHATSWRADKDGGATVLNSWEFSLSGAKPVEGLSASIIGEKTATLYFDRETEIGYVTADNPSTNNYSNDTENYKVTTDTAGTTDTAVAYLKKDISQYINKDIVKVELVAECRANSSANKMEVMRTDATWIASGENEICYNNQPSLDAGVDAFITSYNNTDTERRFDITSLVENLSSEHNGVLGLRVRGILGNGKTGYAVQLSRLNKTDGTGARIVITYKDAIDATGTVTDSFTYQAKIATEGATARLIVGIYDSNRALIDVLASEVLTSNGTDPLSMEVDLTSYEGVAFINAFMWNGTTLVPYFTPITRTATVTAAE